MSETPVKNAVRGGFERLGNSKSQGQRCAQGSGRWTAGERDPSEAAVAGQHRGTMSMSNLSNEEIEACREAFARFDKDGSGSISDWELRAMLQCEPLMHGRAATGPGVPCELLITAERLDPPDSRCVHIRPCSNGTGPYRGRAV